MPERYNSGKIELMSKGVISLQDAEKVYETGELKVPALLDINLEVTKGEMLAIVGPSGSGKSTLMNIIGLLDRPTKGKYFLEGQEITLSMSDRKLAKLRANTMGFIFQSFNLLPRLTAVENVMLPSLYSKTVAKNRRKERAEEILENVGLGHRLKHKPTELSGGEKQRVAIARALMNEPTILLADEPTGNLDSKSGHAIIKILKELREHEDKTVLVVTHDENIRKECQKSIELFDGRIK